MQIGTNCGPNAMTWNMVVANPADESFTAVLQVKTANAEELRSILLTFNYPGSSPRDPNATTTTTPARDDDHYPGRDDNHGPSRNDDNRRLNLATDGCSGDGTVP